MGGDPGHEPGLGATPWVSVRLEAGAVSVDGLPVQADGTPEGRYLSALQQIADEVATPLGRRVGVTVAGAGGDVSHLAVHPDGTVDSIEELVRAAHAPAAAVVVPVARPEPAPVTSPEPQGGRRRSRTLVAAVAVLLAACAVVAAPLLHGRHGELASSGSVDPAAAVGAGGDAAQAVVTATVVAAAPQQVVSGPRLHARPVLSVVAAATGPSEVTLRLAATSRPVHAEVRLRTSDGTLVVRRLRLGPGHPSVVVLAGLQPGVATWAVRGRGGFAIPDAGRIQVMAPPTAPVPAPTPTSGSASSGGHPSSSGGKPGGHPTADPVVPIDPDDQ